jgi:uncharacterized protein with HEPN domain
MLLGIENIRAHTAAGEAEFFRDNKTAHAVAHELLTLGEAAAPVRARGRSAHPEAPWQGLIRRRNPMVHDYFRISPTVLWRFVVDDLDSLERSRRKVSAPPR